MSFDSFNIHNRSDTAVIVFKLRPVQSRAHTDRSWISSRIHPSSSCSHYNTKFCLLFIHDSCKAVVPFTGSLVLCNTIHPFFLSVNINFFHNCQIIRIFNNFNYIFWFYIRILKFLYLILYNFPFHMQELYREKFKKTAVKLAPIWNNTGYINNFFHSYSAVITNAIGKA